MGKEHKVIEINFEDIEKIELECNIVNKIVVNKFKTKYEFLVRKSDKSNRGVIFGSGAYDFKKIKLPVFQRFSWIKEFDENLIFYNDPTLYIGDVSLAWGYGDENEYYLENIGVILEKLLLKVNVKNNDTVIYGSSGGGFMALILAAILKGSIAVVNNPQTNIKTYYKTITEKVFKSIYPNLTLEESLNKNEERLSVVEYFKKEKYVPAIVYLQNLACNYDVKNQMLPFIQNIKELDDNIITRDIELKLYNNKTQNHSPISKEKTIREIKKVFNLDSEFNNCIDIQSSNWELFSKRDTYNIYRYDAKLDKKSIENKYVIKLNGLVLKNTKAKNITKENCCDLYANGYIYISVSNEKVKQEGIITNEDIGAFFSKTIVNVLF